LDKNIEHNVPDDDLPGALQLIEDQGWILLSKTKENGGWTLVSVSPDDPEAPDNADDADPEGGSG
jgi:hypothetical protein